MVGVVSTGLCAITLTNMGILNILCIVNANVIAKSSVEFSRNTQSWHFVLIEFENELDIVIIYINFYFKHYDKCQFVIKWIQLVIIFFRNCTIAKSANLVHYGKPRVETGLSVCTEASIIVDLFRLYRLVGITVQTKGNKSSGVNSHSITRSNLNSTGIAFFPPNIPIENLLSNICPKNFEIKKTHISYKG